MRHLVIVPLVGLLLVGCGGSGAADVPDGYEVFRSDGVSFAHPAGFEAETQANPNGTREITLRAPGAPRDSDYVHLTIAPDRGDDIEPLARSLRVAVEGIHRAQAGEEREVDVDGAVAARRLDIVQPAADGAPEVRRRDLLVLAPDGRFLILDVGAVPGPNGDIDQDAVIDSFRLDGGDDQRSAYP